MKSELFYIHDPMCSWCWGFAGVAKQLFDTLPAEVTVRRLLGGLAADNMQPMPLTMQKSIQDNWLRIEKKIPGMKFNFDFWTACQPRRSTYLSCRAVIAARRQGEEYDERMSTRIQQAYYKEARNPSEIETLIELAADLGLDKQVFTRDLMSGSTQQTLLNEIQLTRDLQVGSFPGLVLKTTDSIWPITIDYLKATPMLESIDMFLKKKE